MFLCKKGLSKNCQAATLIFNNDVKAKDIILTVTCKNCLLGSICDGDIVFPEQSVAADEQVVFDLVCPEGCSISTAILRMTSGTVLVAVEIDETTVSLQILEDEPISVPIAEVCDGAVVEGGSPPDFTASIQVA